VAASRLGSEFMPELDEGDFLYMADHARPGSRPTRLARFLQQTTS